MVTGVGLFSGGLDSTLACMVIRDQGIDVKGITFETPFFLAEKAKKAAQRINLPLTVLDITEEYIPLLKNPPNGYGKNLNPCIDCHAFMLKCAGDYMKQIGADFLFTGEVLGERPKSQNRWALSVVAKDSGYESLVVRPLSAQLLPTTKPESAGLIDRSKLLAISGRGRKEQMRLATHYGIDEYETPAGGCLLTYSGYCSKLKDLFDHYPSASLRHYSLLKNGRHFRLSSHTKLILGKDKSENERLELEVQPEDVFIYPQDTKGPVGIVTRNIDCYDTDEILLAARIVARYCKQGEHEIEMIIRCQRHAVDTVITVDRMPQEDVDRLRI
ncbi:MAG: tRNA 4-thiouridine(8) synthase ThiI [Candidatus Auribacterota bacterium]|jgi:tRNA U34 2-thiouridine synthase MnmA/TrmU|nr:tRNA 4-thiouridine(8) synthase ThiI [Candidatus Auribacterota bacterium]